MPIAFRCGLAVPLWAVAFLAVALGAPLRARPLLMTLLAIGVIASTIPAVLRRFGPSRRRVEVLPALTEPSRAAVTGRAVTIDAADLVRMDDDGGWHAAPRRLP